MGPKRDSVSDTSEPDDSTTDVRASFSSVKTSTIDTKPQSSPLLSSTPPIVSKALVRSYPYLLIVNKLLSIITWTNDDYWINVIIICGYSLFVLYFEQLVTWGGHLIIVGFITLYALLNNKILEEANLHPSLDEVVQTLTNTCVKADRLLDPIISLSLTGYDIKRLLFTTVFLTPIYLIFTFLLIKPRTILLIVGTYLLTYHSSYMSVTRKMIWKIKLTRVLFFYLTGLDFSKQRNHSLFAAAFAKVQKNAGHSLNPLNSSGSRPVRFTYVIYENQRRWLGIGWTSNLLSYERTPWTDEFLNESSSIDTFKLPNPENQQDYSFGQDQSSQLSMNNARWRWVDKTWRLDSTNDGSITLPSWKRSKTTANPDSDEGFIYYDNTWKKPSTEDSYSKYTRRRRWIRTAELVFDGQEPGEAEETGKKLRFADPEPEQEEEEEAEAETETAANPSDLIDMDDVAYSKEKVNEALDNLAHQEQDSEDPISTLETETKVTATTAKENKPSPSQPEEGIEQISNKPSVTNEDEDIKRRTPGGTPSSPPASQESDHDKKNV